jgi:tetratricopeptide (TPR) repeat protein
MPAMHPSSTCVAAAFLVFAVLAPGSVRATYVGAASLFGLARVTVVYSTGPDSDLETNRLCAERRAAYLRHKHGVDATVVADDEVTPEQLLGDLLVLGWDNRLIGTERTPKPFARAEGGRTFLGSIRVADGEDLLFAVSSPFEPARQFVFWSRTDVEIDRYLPMPFTGSDWAVFRDCTIQRQGNFASADAWPPTRNVYAEQDHAAVRGKLSAMARSPRYTLHYVPESYTPQEAERVLAAREGALRRAVELLGDPGPDFRIDLFVYPDRATKRSETDVNDVVHSVPAARALHVTADYASSPSPHEEIHLVARALWGPCYHTALYEGLAVALERASDLDRFAAVAVDRKSVPPLSALLDEERLRALTADAIAFPASGLFVRWLLERGGLDVVRGLYSAKPLTVERVAKAIGTEPPAVDAAFAGWVGSRAANVDPELRYAAALADVDQFLGTGRPSEAVAAAERALELRNGDPVARLKLATALSAGGRKAEAEGILREMVGLPPEGETLRYAVHARYRLALLLDETGRHDEARGHYDAILALPDVDGSHRAVEEELGIGGP